MLLEARPYRPFKSSEEYLEAMKEDLAEWLNILYPELTIKAENFMDRLDTGVALCKHANNVRQSAEEYLAKRQARNKCMARSMTSGLAGPILAMGNVHNNAAAKSGTFFARDNVSNFITWCRKGLRIFECLLFETDDLIMRKNEKHVILCLLEVARRGAKFGMLAPMLVQMERQIDREIAADNRANGIGCGTQTDLLLNGSLTMNAATETEELFDTDTEDEDDTGPMLMYGPQPQIVTNDLKSLDEMVRDLVEKCTCPSQFPMVRVSEGKYRIGDTKVLIFVRILRSHVMVRVGGGWDTLSHYLDKHDPCRCKSQHRTPVGARLITRNNQTNGIDLNKAQVIFERSPPPTRKVISAFNGSTATASTPSTSNSNVLSPPSSSVSKTRSRSPTPQRKYLNQIINASETNNIADKLNGSPLCTNRSMSPSPRRLIDIRKKQTSLDAGTIKTNELQYDNPNVMTNSGENANGQLAEASKFENLSDNGSEISDEGYRSLGVIQSNGKPRESMISQNSAEDAELNVRLDQTSSESQLTPSDEQTESSSKTAAENTAEISNDNSVDLLDTSPGVEETSALDVPDTSNNFENSGVFITDDEITVDIANATGLRPTNFSAKILNNGPASLGSIKPQCGIPRPPRRRSIDGGSVTDLSTRTGLPVFVRNKPEFSSVRKPHVRSESPRKTPVRDVTNTWNGRTPTGVATKKRPQISCDTFSSPTFERNSKTRASQILYDSNGRRVRGSASLTTSPVKNHTSYQTSPLAQQLLDAASSAKNDAQILEKMKVLLSKYGSPSAAAAAKSGKKSVYEDFTSAWVHSNGNLERSSSCSPPTRVSKRSSAASSIESAQSRNADASAIVAPRKERGLSRIPGPIRQNTELY